MNKTSEQPAQTLTQNQVKEHVQQSLYLVRKDVGRYGLSASVSIMFSVSGYPVAYAHTGAVVTPPVTPVVHAFHHNAQPIVPAPTTPTTSTQTTPSATNIPTTGSNTHGHSGVLNSALNYIHTNISTPTGHGHHSNTSTGTPQANNAAAGSNSGGTTAATSNTGNSAPQQPGVHQNNSAANTASTTGATSSTSGKHTNHRNNAATTTTGAVTNLNLGSAKENMSASLLGNFQTLTLNIGGKTDVVTMNSKLTDAEFIAAQQVLNGGNAAGAQTLTLNAHGTAQGGTINLNNGLLTSLNTSVGGAVTSFTIPQHVTVDDSVSSLNLSGAFNNHGSVVLQPVSGTTESISASTIKNAGSIAGKNVDLTLTAQSIVNSGTIQTGSNVTINSGQINNTGGTIAAANTVNVSNPGGISIQGGNILSQTLNLNAGSKDLNVNGTNITGVVNNTAGNAHINATSQNFQLGNSNILNDPLYSSTGNFTIVGNVETKVGAPISIVAAGNIYSGANAQLTTAATTGNGGNLLLVAGADFTVDSSNNLTIIQSLNPGGGSATGGTIDLTGSQTGGAPITAINTSTSDTTGSGGPVTMVAYSGSAAGSGQVILPSSVTIRTGNDSQALAGNVDIYAGAKSGTAISIGNIDASSTSASSAATVNLATAKPLASGVVIDSSGNQSGSFSADLAHLQPADITVGNINANSGSTSATSTAVNISSGGAVSFNSIDTSGYGGVGTVGAVGGGGGNAGAVTITAKNGVSGANIFAYGGGGGGGGAAVGAGVDGFDGGGGGAGGNVQVTTGTGNISVTGMVNASGGGGGGGGANNGGTSGNGGQGGNSAAIALTAGKGTVAVNQGIFAVDGGNGGAGDTINPGISGGGGGGSYGGGGGAGANNPAVSLNGSSGGGGGLWGGGGAGAQANSGNPGSGGGAGTGGLGGGGVVTNGGYNTGGLGFFRGTVSLGFGGQSYTGVNGDNVINNGNVAGGQVSLTSSTGIGTKAAPQQILAPLVSLLAPSGSIYVDSQAGMLVNGLSASKTGTISIAAGGDLGIFNPATVSVATVKLSITPPAGGTNSLSGVGNLTASDSITFSATGKGNIASLGTIITPLLTLNADSGNTAVLPSSAAPNQIGGIQFNSNGVVDIIEKSNINILASSAGTLIVNSTNGNVTISGPVTSKTTALIVGETGINLQNQVTALGGLTLQLISGKLTAPAGITNSGSVQLVEPGNVGTLTINTPELSLSATSANITDNYTGVTLVQASAPGPFGAGTNFVFNSAGSQVTVGGPGISNFNNVTINDTNATGSIVFNNGGINAANTISLSTIGGDVTSTGTAVLQAASVNLTTQSGNINGAAAGNGLDVEATNLTIAASSTASNVRIFSNNAIALGNVTANQFSIVAGNTIGLNGQVSADTMSLNAQNGVLQTNAAALVTGNQIFLGSGLGSVDSAVSSKGLVIALTGANSSLSLDGTNAKIQSAGDITLGTVFESNNLQITSAGAIIQTAGIQAVNNAILQGTTFTQNAGTILNANDVSIVATTGTAGSVALDGATNANTVSITTPVNGVITLGPGAQVLTQAGTFTATKVILQGTGVTASVITSDLNTGELNNGTLTFNGAGAGAFTLTGTGNIGAEQNLNFTSGGNLTIANTVNFGGPSHDEVINATGVLNLPTNTVTVATDASGNGGILSITASNILVNGKAVSATNALTFNADADQSAGGTGNGGSASLTLTGTTLATVGGANSEYTFNAAAGLSGGNGGTIYFKNGGAITVADPNALNMAVNLFGNADGGNLSLISGGNLIVNGNLITPTGLTGNDFGTMVLTSNGTTPFTVNDTANPTNGVAGALSASRIFITNEAGITFGTLNSPVAVTIPGANFGLPELVLNTNLVTFNGGQIADPFELVVAASNNLSFAGITSTSFSGKGPSIVFMTAGGNMAAPIQLVGNSINTNEQSLTLMAGGALTLPTLPGNTIAVNSDVFHDGGIINITAASIKGVTGALNLQANGTTGNPGIVTFHMTGKTAVNLGGDNSTLNISATGGAGAPGQGDIVVTAAGTLTVDNNGSSGNGLTLTSGDNYFVDLASTGGNLFVTNAAVPALNTTKTDLVLGSNSATAFAVGGTVGKNGIDLQGTKLNTLDLSINNTGGGVALNENLQAFNLVVTAEGNITQANAKTLSATNYTLQSTNGNIGSAGSQLVLASNAGATVKLSTGSATGVINVRDQGTTGDVLSAATGGSSFTFASSGDLSVSAPITATTVNLTAGPVNNTLALNQTVGNGTGTVTLDAGGALSQTNGIVDAKTLSFLVGTMATPLVTDATTIASSSVLGASPTIDIQDTNKTTVTIQGLTTANSSGNIFFISGGNIVVTGGVGTANLIGANQATSTTLIAGGDSSITTKNAGLIAGNTVTLTGKNLGTTASALELNAPNLNINATGVVNLNVTGVNTSQFDLLSDNGIASSFKLTTDGRMNIGTTITARGDITIDNLASPNPTDLGGIGLFQSVTSLNGNISLTSENTHLSAISVNGDLNAKNVTISNLDASPSFSSFSFGGIVGNGKGIVTIDSSQVYTLGLPLAEIEGTTLNLDVGFAFAAGPGQPIHVSVAKINQTAPSSFGLGLALADTYAGNVTVSNLKDTSGGSISVSAANGMTIGKVSTTGAVDVEAGGSLTLNGNIGDVSGNAGTILVAGKSLPPGTGGTTLTAAKGVQIYGQVISLTNGGGGISGASGKAIATNATIGLNISAFGDVNAANNSGGSVVTADISQVGALTLVNTSTTGGGLNVLEAKAPLAGNMSITSKGGELTLGGGTFSSLGSMKLVSTGTGADGNVTILDGTTINAGGALTITSGKGASVIQIGQTGGAGVSINGNGVTISSADKTGAASVTIGDNVSVTSTGALSIVSPTSLAVGSNFTNQATVITLNAQNGAFTAGDGLNLQARTGLSILSNGTNGSITLGSNTISMVSTNPVVDISTSGALTIGSLSGAGDTNISAPNAGNITLSGFSVTLQGGGGAGTFINGGNVTITATGATGGTVSLTGTPADSIITVSNNLMITSTGTGGDITIGDGYQMSANGTLTIATSAVNLANVTFGAAATASGGAASVQASGSVTLNDGAQVNSTSTDVRNNSVNISAGSDISVGNGTIISAGGSVNMQSQTGSITLGVAGGSNGVQLTANNGDVSVVVLSSSKTLNVEDNTTITAESVFANMGNVTLQAGKGTQPLTPLTVAVPNVTVNGIAPLVTTTLFTANGPTTLNGQAAQITLNNQTGSVGGITFAGNNTVTADPPAGALMAPRSVLEAAMPHFDVLSGSNLVDAPANSASALMSSINGDAISTPAAVSAPLSGANPDGSQTTRNSPSIANGNLIVPAVSRSIDSTGASSAGGGIGIVGSGSVQSVGGVTAGPGVVSALGIQNGASSIANPVQTIGRDTAGGTIIANAPSSVYANFFPANAGAQYGTVQAAFNSVNAASALNNLQATGRLQSSSTDENMLAAVTKSSDLSAVTAATKTLSGGIARDTKSSHPRKGDVLTDELRNGATLVAPDRLTVLNTPFGNVCVASRAVALVVCNDTGLHVYNLDDTHRDSVTIHVNGESISLATGAHITITDKKVESFEQVNPARFIAYRRVQTRDLNGNLRAFHTQFQHLSAISGLEPLRNVMKSSDPALKKIGQHMLKTSALLQMMDASAVPYELQQAPSVTAMQR